MKTYTTLRNLAGTLTNNTVSTHLTTMDQLINDNTRYLIQKFNLHERTKTAVTVASQQAYTFPYNYKKLINVTVTVGSTIYAPTEITSRNEWDRLNSNPTSPLSDTPQYYYVYNNQVLLYPTPATSSNTITYHYKVRTRDLSQADYTTGTVSITTATTVVTGSGTTFVADMVRRWIQVTAPAGIKNGTRSPRLPLPPC